MTTFSLANISLACDVLQDPILFWAIFLVSFFAFLRISNVAPHSLVTFSPRKHLQKDIIFAPPGAHVFIKWAKNMQDAKKYKFIQIPQLRDSCICPTTALRKLLQQRKSDPDSPLFSEQSTGSQIIDTKIRSSLKLVLQHLGIPSNGHNFHAFRGDCSFWPSGKFGRHQSPRKLEQ